MVCIICKMNIEKVIRDGMVAVLYSPGYGAGWSTWASYPLNEICMFDPKVVAWVEGGKKGHVPIQNYDKDFYSNGSSSLEIEWVPIGTAFEIREYDGFETIYFKDEIKWLFA